MAPLVLFVCTGNTCRSPMAEALFKLSCPRTLRWRAASAGIAASDGSPASEAAVAVIAEKGGDLSGHRSQPLWPQLMRSAAVVVTMTSMHADQLAQYFPAMRDRIFLMRSFDPDAPASAPLSDPFGSSLQDYRQCRDLIQKAMPGLIRYLKQIDAENR